MIPPKPESSLKRWRPLLSQDRADLILDSVREMLAALGTTLEEFKQRYKTGEKHSYSGSLGSEAAEISLFLAYLKASGVMPECWNLGRQYLDFAVEMLSQESMGFSLHGGFIGIAWTVQHIAGLLGGPEYDLNEIDEAIESSVSKSPWKNTYDLIAGLVGIGVYCLERRNACTARSLERIIERLYELAELLGDEARWFTPPELLFDQQKQLYPNGFYNLGLAHGAPGVIALLGKAHEAGIARDRAEWLLERAVPWFLKQRLPSSAHSSFAAFIGPGRTEEDCRLAWCYGDAGAAAALLLAARCTSNSSWEQEALSIAANAAKRAPDSCGVRDACFCHGSAGLAHIFNRIYQATRQELFAEASRYWLDRTLQFRKPGQGAAGYLVWTQEKDETMVLAARFNFLEGIAGIGLALLAAISDLEPAWDRLCMLDVSLNGSN